MTYIKDGDKILEDEHPKIQKLVDLLQEFFANKIVKEIQSKV